MPPDTTRSFLETLANPNNLLALIATVVGIIASVIGMVAIVLPWLKQWRDRRSLRRRLGATLYTPEDIERATRHYIRPHCQSIDPAQGPEISGVYASREDLFSAIDRLLDQPAESKYLLLLADSGMGKTSFLLNYYARYLRRFRKPFHVQVIPTGIRDADARIQQIENKSDTVLFLDALDEDTLAIVDHRQRILDLCNLTREFRRVFMTCRTQFFPRAEEEPRRTGVVKLTSISAGREGEYIFHKLYLSPFDDGQVKKYLRRRYTFWRWLKRRRAKQVADKIPQLTARPMLLAHIDDLLASGREFNYSFQLYEEMVEAWLTREEGRVEGLQKEPLREFCERLAIELFARRQAEGGERLPYDAIEPLAQKFGVKLEGWKLSGRSLLN
ncbi:MAG: NACHT domain-containing protein, partial [bacterium]